MGEYSSPYSLQWRPQTLRARIRGGRFSVVNSSCPVDGLQTDPGYGSCMGQWMEEGGGWWRWGSGLYQVCFSLRPLSLREINHRTRVRNSAPPTRALYHLLNPTRNYLHPLLYGCWDGGGGLGGMELWGGGNGGRKDLNGKVSVQLSCDKCVIIYPIHCANNKHHKNHSCHHFIIPVHRLQL